jgi:hypothetical protein
MGARDRLVAPEHAAPRDVSLPLHEWPIDLDQFEPVTSRDLEKLEIYALANCASVMTYVDPGTTGQRPVPWIESFGNEHDIVARLGMLAPRPEHWGIRLDGPRYMRPGGWGHLLNDHYLQPIESAQRVGYKRGGRGGAAPFRLLNPEAVHEAAPRLFAYINGGAPSAPIAAQDPPSLPDERMAVVETG